MLKFHKSPRGIVGSRALPATGFLLVLSMLFVFTQHVDAQVWADVGHPGFSASHVQNTSVAIAPNGVPYVAYAYGSGVTIKKFDGVNWLTVGSPDLAICYGSISLAFDTGGTPYVAFQDGGGGKATVMKFVDTGWALVGSAGFSLYEADYLSLAIDRSGTPYVAFDDYHATVMKFDGSSWVYVGSPAFSADLAEYTDIAFDSSNIPYVVFSDYAHGSRATVMKFDGTSWVSVGPLGFSDGSVSYTTLAIDSSGTPYIAFEDGGHGLKISAMKYDGSNWVYVGSPGFSPYPAMFSALALDRAGNPFVAYSDNYESEGYVTVMKYIDTAWENEGAAHFSGGQGYYISMIIDSNGLPYVAYEDYGNGANITVMTIDTNITDINMVGLDTICSGATTILNDSASGGSWSAGNPTIATIDTATGIVTGIAPGKATFFYSLSGYWVSVKVKVDSIPALTTSLSPSGICDSAAFTYSPLSNVSGTSFSWTRDTVAGIGNEMNAGTGGVDEILVDNTALPASAIYVYTLTANGCTRVENVTVDVTPPPQLTTPLILPSICDTSRVIYFPTASIAGTAFSWCRAPVGGISNPIACSTDDINELLVNTTSTPITVTYVYTLTAHGCTTDTFPHVTITIDPCGPDLVNNLKEVTQEVCVFPNPATSSFSLFLENCNGAATISICDMTGRVMEFRNVEILNKYEVIFHTEKWPSGIYFIKINVHGDIYQRKISVLGQ